MLSHKAEHYQEELAPKAEQVKNLSNRLKEQDGVIMSEISQVKDLHR